MGIPATTSFSPRSPLGEACLRMDLTAIHEILETISYKDDEGQTNEVLTSYLFIHKSQYYFYSCVPFDFLISHKLGRTHERRKVVGPANWIPFVIYYYYQIEHG